MRKLAALAACVALAGCWQSSGSQYQDRPSLLPLRAGVVEGRNLVHPKEHSHDRLTRSGDGYRLTNDDRKDSDFGESFGLRFFALAGAPSDVLVYEADEGCKPTDKACKPGTATRYYGLARVSRQGADVINPECAKNSFLRKWPGVTIDGYGTCTFANRAALEKALSVLAASRWKADVIYRYIDSSR